MEFLENRCFLRKSRTSRKSPEKWTFLSLAFYNAPSLHTVDLMQKYPGLYGTDGQILWKKLKHQGNRFGLCFKMGTFLTWRKSWKRQIAQMEHTLIGRVSETPTPTGLERSTAVHLQFVRQYAPHLYRCTFLASKPWRKGNPAVHLPFLLQYASHLYGSTPPICTAVLLRR